MMFCVSSAAIKRLDLLLGAIKARRAKAVRVPAVRPQGFRRGRPVPGFRYARPSLDTADGQESQVPVLAYGPFGVLAGPGALHYRERCLSGCRQEADAETGGQPGHGRWRPRCPSRPTLPARSHLWFSRSAGPMPRSQRTWLQTQRNLVGRHGRQAAQSAAHTKRMMTAGRLRMMLVMVMVFRPVGAGCSWRVLAAGSCR